MPSYQKENKKTGKTAMADVECWTEGPDPDSVFTCCVEDILDYNNANKCQDLHDYWTYSNNTRVQRTSLVFSYRGSKKKDVFFIFGGDEKVNPLS